MTALAGKDTELRDLTVALLAGSTHEIGASPLEDEAFRTRCTRYWTQQRVVPAIARRLAPDATLPDPWRVWAGEVLRENALCSLEHFDRLSAISGLLSETAGIESMPLKGVVLSLLLYGDPGFRQCGDIDLLVPETRFDDAVLLLQRNGYTQRNPAHFAPDGRLKPSYRPFRQDAGLVSAPGDHVVEVHLRLCKQPGLLPDRYDEIRRTAVPVVAGGTTFQTPGPEVLLAWLAEHAMFSRWSAMKWLYDLPFVIDLFDDTALESAYQQASRAGFVPLLDAALVLGNRVIGREPPAARGSATRCAWLVDQVWRRLADGSYAVENRRDPLQLVGFRMRLLSGFQARWGMAKVNAQSLLHH